MFNKWYFAPTLVFSFGENRKRRSNNVLKKGSSRFAKNEIQPLTFCTLGKHQISRDSWEFIQKHKKH